MQKLIILIILINNLTFGQEKIYQLISKSVNSDINYKAFKKFNDFSYFKNEGHKTAFIPKKGRSEVYVFISEFEGNSFDGTIKKFHDYLILKCDPKTNLILDGFQYTIEWTDSPTVDLYQVTERNVKLKDNLELDFLKMELVKQDDTTILQRNLIDNGKLKIKN